MPSTTVTIEATIQAPVEKVWNYWTQPEHITQWNYAIPEWHTPWAKNDLREGGSFSFRMEARDGSMGFEFGGVYDTVKLHEQIATTLGDGRKTNTVFTAMGDSTKVVESFETETMNPVEMQRAGWQSILNNFKQYTETH
ncbi:MAG: SRPBCC family protein [Bacteroidetes bacterium]|nr:SRPBCC family protein [Bacteroidota bacterium]